MKQLTIHDIINEVNKEKMKNHTNIYFKALGYDETDFIPSEISGQRAVDIHHIDCKGMGGNPLKDKDRIENLQAVTREEHRRYGDRKECMFFLYSRHYNFLIDNGVKFDKQYLIDKMNMYYEDYVS
tara:strand:+ start:184 stop:561 length:378 start_codon:yes stop_codon:yes gene_type:complete